MFITIENRFGGDADAGAWVQILAPTLGALFYPFVLEGFNAKVTQILELHGGTFSWPWLGAAMYLALAFAIPLLAMLAAISLAGINRPTSAQLRATRTALLVVAAPALFTFVGVVLRMLHDPVPDGWLWAACWALALALLVRSDNNAPARLMPRLDPGPLRAAHGVSALILVMIFLAPLISNHLMFSAGTGTYEAVKVLRHVYHTGILQPVVATLLLFQIGTGLFFAWRLTGTPSDAFRTFQIGSGIYLAVYVLGHMNWMLTSARIDLGIDAGGSPATGAPAGLLADAWNIRLVPHYWFAVFFMLAHLANGARAIILAHGFSKTLADRFMVGSGVVAGIIATVITLGMCGMRIRLV